MRFGPILLIVISALMAFRAGTAQTVSGRLLESGSREPILLGRVVLADSAFRVVQETLTDHNGNFTLQAPGPGSYWVAAERIGYWPAADGMAELGEGGFLPINFYLRPKPLELEGIVAEVERRRIREQLDRSGFYRRFQEGFGHFITPMEIEKRPPADVPDLLRAVPGVRFSSQGVNGDVLYFRARGKRPPSADALVPPGYCRPLVYVDGIRMTMEPRHGIEVAIHELVRVHDVAAVEVYQGNSVPLQWGGSEGSCGVVLFWTGGVG